MKVAILGGFISPKETTMFDQFFTRQAAVVRYQSLPFAAELQLYLTRLVEEGRSRKTVRNIAQLLVVVVRHLRLDRPEITLAEIEAAAVEWAGTAHRSRRCLHVGERQFVYHATGLLRLLGRFHESRPEVAYAARLADFLHFQSHQRCLLPSTLHHYEMCVGEFLNWIALQRKPLEEVSLEDISEYFQALAPCYGPHALRHSCATHLLAEGVSLKEIADHLGHVSLTATQMYAKVDLPALHEVGALPLTGLVEFAANSERAATPIQMRGSIEALRGFAAISLGGLL
jgi:hypothetical protein